MIALFWQAIVWVHRHNALIDFALLGNLYSKMVDRIENFFMALSGLLLHVNTSSTGLDRADYICLIANDYRMTMHLMLRRLQDRTDDAIDGRVVEAGQYRFPMVEIMKVCQCLLHLCGLLSDRVLALSKTLFKNVKETMKHRRQGLKRCFDA